MKDASCNRELDKQGQRDRKRWAEFRDIGARWPPANSWHTRRRNRYRDDLRGFLECYFPAAFNLAWSADHLRVIARLERCIKLGGQFALAMPRGSGKTALCVRASLWGLLYGWRRFVVLVGATERLAAELLKTIKTELQFNDLLGQDFAHVCFPLRELGGSARRAPGQLLDDQPTSITWTADALGFPIVSRKRLGSACDVSGSLIAVAGLTGSVRGLSHTLPSGQTIRPDLVIADDPQTRESAASPAQTAERLALVQGDLLGLAGPGLKISCLITLTVIRQGDLADQLLDRKLHPEWQGERTKAVQSWPANQELWDRYLALRAEGLRQDKGTGEASDHYRANREAMDAGAVVSWEARHTPDQLSALQAAYDARQDLGEEAYAAEYQNEPLLPAEDDLSQLSVDLILSRCNGLAAGVLPVRTEHLTAFVDVHDALLFWCVTAWSKDFTGWVLAYGAWPRQHSSAISLRKADPSLTDAAPGAGREGAIRAGLVALANELLGREWRREDGLSMRIGRCLVDSGYVAGVVYDFCRHSPHAATLLPSRGLGLGPTQKPIREWIEKQGERLGDEWVLTRGSDRAGRAVRFDAHHWKSFVASRLLTSLGDPGSLSLWGHVPGEHRLFAEHLCSEKPELLSGAGRTVAVWGLRPGQSDNHWLDCLVGCAVAASVLGARLPGATAETRTRKVINFRRAWEAAQQRRNGT